MGGLSYSFVYRFTIILNLRVQDSLQVNKNVWWCKFVNKKGFVMIKCTMK